MVVPVSSWLKLRPLRECHCTGVVCIERVMLCWAFHVCLDNWWKGQQSITLSSLASHTLHRAEEESGHTATIKLSPWQKLDVTNQICALRRLPQLSWSNNYITCLVDVSILLLAAMFDNCVSWRQLGGCSVTRPFLSLWRVWLSHGPFLLGLIPLQSTKD